MPDLTLQRPAPAMTPADIAAHQAASHVRTTAQGDDPNGPWLPKIPRPRPPRTQPLNPAAQAALHRLQRALTPAATR